MTPELWWLLMVALLAGSLWIPYIVGVNITDFPGKKDIFVRPPDLSAMPAWVHRSFRAHLNALEQLLPFAVVIIVGKLAGVSTPITRVSAEAFFFFRLAHAVGYVTGLARAPIRPALYFAGWVAMLASAEQILAAG